MAQITVNDVVHTVEADPATPLLWVLRDILQLPGTRFGCGRGLCGACTVHLGGAPIRACVTPLSVAATGPITTIEGLAATRPAAADASGADALHPLQQAWIDHGVPQCGYCQAGQLMSAAALLARDPRPDDAAIDAAMSGNICRCGTYPRIRAAIKAAAAKLPPPPPPPAPATETETETDAPAPEVEE